MSTEDLKSTAKYQLFYHLTQSYFIILVSFPAGSMVLVVEACISDVMRLCSLVFAVAFHEMQPSTGTKCVRPRRR
jgi:hypothetical protein